MNTRSSEHRGVLRVPYGEVEAALGEPLLAVTHSAIDVRRDVEPASPMELFRGHSAPCVGDATADKEKPPKLFPRPGPSVFRLRTALLLIGVYFTVGALAFYQIGKIAFGVKAASLIDALYFCAVTLTTTGYGDLVPQTPAGKVFTCVYLLVGFSIILTVLSRAAVSIIEKQEKIIVQAIKKKNKKVFEQAEEDHVKSASGRAFVSGVQLTFLLLMGQACLMHVEGLSFIDAFYCVCVTITTLGYGDYSFQSQSGRLFAVVWILASTVSLAQFLLFLAEMKTLKRQLQLAKWVLHRKTTKPDLDAADFNGDGKVSAPEFLIFKLKELGKVNEEDVVGILREFQMLDCDHSGCISVGDLSRVRES